MALRYLVVLVPLAVALACSGKSTSHGPGGGVGADGGSGGSSATGGIGGSTTGSGGDLSKGTGGAGAIGGSDEVGGTGALGGSGEVGGTGALGGTGAVGGSDTGGKGGTGENPCGEGGCIPDLPGDPIDPPGPVFCGGVECAAGEACCIANGECFDPARDPEACPEPPASDDDPWGRRPCNSNAQCGEREFCQLDGVTCEGTGHCNPRTNCGGCGGDCTLCGCDGNTYPDVQTACLAGANAPQHGACGTPVETGGGGSGAGGELPVIVRTPCATTTQCPDGQTCCPRYGFCLTDDDPYLCGDAPAGTSRPCTADEHCDPGQYCLGDGCEGPGGCVSPGSQGDCGVRLEPVCGCNGVSYTSAACASTEYTRVASEGACPSAGAR